MAGTTSPRRGRRGRGLRVQIGFFGILFGCWNDQRSPRCSGGKYTVEPREVSAGRRHENCQFRHEVLPLENDCARAISPGPFQTVEQPSIRQRRQTFCRRHGGPARIGKAARVAHGPALRYRHLPDGCALSGLHSQPLMACTLKPETIAQRGLSKASRLSPST